ncbi:LysE family transporter, partial [Streptomyces althioticus]
MFGVNDLTTYVLGALVIILLPGPNSLYVLSVAARKGIRTGYRAAAGVFVGDLTLISL